MEGDQTSANGCSKSKFEAAATLTTACAPIPTIVRANTATSLQPDAVNGVLSADTPPGGCEEQAGSLRVQLQKEIAERELAQQALRESDSHFRALVMASSDVVYRMNADWSEMAPLQGRNFIADSNASRTWFQENIPLSDQPGVRAAIDEAIRTKSIFELEHRVRRADGSEGWTFRAPSPCWMSRVKF